MDPVTIRVICGILAIVLLALIVLRRRQRAQQ
jgi:MYXO-CTERM domain-containing protein